MDEHLSNAELRQLLQRINQRSSLSSLAAKLASTSPPPSVPASPLFKPNYFGEQVRKEVCGSLPGDLDKVGFTCDSQFDCDTNSGFAGCAEGQFSICQTDFGCKNAQFECTDTEGGKNNTGEVYSCAEFSCEQTATGAGNYGFSCDTIDFFCGDDFMCSGGPLSFECNSGHLFACTDNHTCGRKSEGTDGFACNSTGYQGNGNYHEGSAGDFFCGFMNEGGQPQKSEFDCNMDFGCVGKSDFECGGMHGGQLPNGQGGGDFDCHSGDGAGQFNCGTGAGSPQFSCQNTAQFSQCQVGVDFSCAQPFEYSGTPNPPY